MWRRYRQVLVGMTKATSSTAHDERGHKSASFPSRTLDMIASYGLPHPLTHLSRPGRAKILSATLLFALALFALSCDLIPMARPEKANLVGTYRLTQASRAFLLNDKHYTSVPDSTIDLRGDSTASIRNFPDCATNASGESGGQFLSGDGTWNIEKGFLTYDVVLDVEAGGSLPEGLYPNLATVGLLSIPLTLDVTVGDPDSGESLHYARRGN